MLGWFADSFRFAWALLYWNTRKSWFRLRRGRVACPCQSPSDSGRAFETMCDACLTWHRPQRFRRVCPLLVETKDGLRCSVDTRDVRPFWGVAVRYYGGTLLALYAAAVLSVFAVLRTIGYPVSIVHVALPPLWHRVGQARGWFFLSRAQQAFAAGRTNEGLLYLANGYEFDPTNYEAGLSLAKAFQLGNPPRSDQLFAELLAEHPDHRHETAQNWYRALVARGEFGLMAKLAGEEVLRDSRHSAVWLRALLFATRHQGDIRPLEQLLQNPAPAARRWHRLLATELLIRRGRTFEARTALLEGWDASAPPFTVVYRVEALANLKEPAAALDLLERERRRIDDEAWITVRLHCLAVAQATQVLRAEFTSLLLEPPLTQPLLKIMCAQLIRHPDPDLMARLLKKVSAENMPLTDLTAGGWFSLLCTAGVSGDAQALHGLVVRLQNASGTPFSALLMVESFFRGQLADDRATQFLPFLPLPLEVTYAVLDRYPGKPASPKPAERP